ncbi:LysR family transcriptional regulator [Paracoccus sp. 1_MG-2023]|uniref:LysR family transcriptional regulator n=1 Tax=unclassified Paracoccus (in: a-proteobacteria) TaxID=2688777 RepID=UPI001C089EBD|nr:MULTISPECIES: LysR family transcriptional regulator [unclassified Paracoccus (in: a-proteobacteria)]MBU2959204.1 LysR family transcriptional regulator [Paracoccus sp. C2R09]MDO6670059.1 LysR family transcriptional regulator [Paracoccus sp. 1_MG-2023]
MKHRQVEAFRFVMQTGTTAQAAKLMSVTQPAISRLIADLEIHLQFKLFERSKGRLHPTPEAIRFYSAVDRFFIGMDALEHSAQQLRDRSPTTLKVFATPALSTGILPRAIARFRELHANVAFQLETASYTQIALRLQTHQASLGITHAFPDLPGLTQEPFLTAAHVCAMHHTHPLASKAVITPQDLTGENMLRILPEGNVDWDATTAVLEQSGVRFRSDIATQSSHTGYALIARNLAIGLIEPFAADPWRRSGVVTRPFEPSLDFTYVVARPEAQPVSGMVDAFIEVLRQIHGPDDQP